jgi:hypothetical protein
MVDTKYSTKLTVLLITTNIVNNLVKNNKTLKIRTQQVLRIKMIDYFHGIVGIVYN